jgi:tetratricopeptide (TPR) repeat protein
MRSHSSHDTPSGAHTRHQPFTDALARTRRRSPQWLRCRAGLRVLEFLDRVWLKRSGFPISDHRRRVLRDCIRVVRPRATRETLGAIVDLIAAGVAPRGEILAGLERYAERLLFEGDLKLAAHVFRIVIDVANDENLIELLPSAYERAAWCLFEQGDGIAAMANYAVGYEIATRLGHAQAAIRIAIAQANLHRAVGRMTQARDILDPVLRTAKQLGVAELVARAAHERGIVAHILGEYIEALGYYAEADLFISGARDRNRLLNDIGLSLAQLGHGNDARTAWRTVYVAAKGEAYARWAAGINLMMMAHESGDPIVFEQFAKELVRAPMPARLLIAYWIEFAEGCARFGRSDESRAAYDRAADLAARHGFPKEHRLALDALRGHTTRVEHKSDVLIPLSSNVIELVKAVRAQHSFPSFSSRSAAGGAETLQRPALRTSLRRGRPPRSDAS